MRPEQADFLAENEADFLAENNVRAALIECLPVLVSKTLLDHSGMHDLCNVIKDDAIAFARKDPACGHDVRNIFQTVTSFQAVLHYRIAHWILDIVASGQSDMEDRDSLFYAMLVSKRGKLLSGADIHPKCQIGQRFILDHGFGNVIGETAVLGDDVYCNGGVILGSARIFGNTSDKRHPTLGNNIQIGGLVGIYGPVTIGDDVFIGARCTISSDIPARSRIILKAENQIVSTI